jgi:hypothetical protein
MEPSRAVGVDETDGVQRACPTCRVPRRRYCLFADRLAGYLDPLFPFARGLRLVVGVQQQSPAQRAPAMLRLKQA